VAEEVSYRAPRRTVISNVTGQPVDVELGELVSADYWVRQIQTAVRFAQGVKSALQAGARTFLECGPDGVLSALAADCVDDLAEVVLLPTLRKNQEESTSILNALAGLHVNGRKIDWTALIGDARTRRVELPTYAFQRQRYWLEVTKAPADIPSLGLSSTGHPILKAAATLGDGEGVLLTGRLSLKEHPWAADYGLFDTNVLPETAILDIALTAGLSVGSARVLDLTLAAPVVLPSTGGLALRMHLEAPDAEGRRVYSLHSRDESANGSVPWVRHAGGVLGPPGALEPSTRTNLQAWPPAGATRLEVSELYARLAARGLDCGPVFQGLTSA